MLCNYCLREVKDIPDEHDPADPTFDLFICPWCGYKNLRLELKKSFLCFWGIAAKLRNVPMKK